MRIFKLYGLFLAANIVANSAQSFEIDLSIDEFIRNKSPYLVADLAVGVPMTVATWAFCVEGSELFIKNSAGFAEVNSYSNRFKVSILPTGEVNAELLESKPSAFDKTVRKKMYSALPSLAPCDKNLESSYFQPNLGFRPVNSINGMSNLADFINNLIEQGYEWNSD